MPTGNREKLYGEGDGGLFGQHYLDFYGINHFRLQARLKKQAPRISDTT